MDEGAWMKKRMKKIDTCKSDKSPLGINRVLNFLKLIFYQYGIYKIFKILIPSWVGF